MSFVRAGNPLQNLLIKILGVSSKDYITLMLNWSNIVGDYLADHSYVFNIENDVMFVGVSNSVIMQEMCLIRDTLRNKIKTQLKIEVKDIIFFIKDDAIKN